MGLLTEFKYLKEDIETLGNNIDTYLGEKFGYHHKPISIPVPTFSMNLARAQVYSFIRAYLYLNWENPTCSFEKMPKELSRREVMKIRRYINDSELFALMLKSDLDNDESLLERIMRATWKLKAPVNHIDFILDTVEKGIKDGKVSLFGEPNLDYAFIAENEAKLTAGLIIREKVRNCLMVPPRLIFENLTTSASIHEVRRVWSWTTQMLIDNEQKNLTFEPNLWYWDNDDQRSIVLKGLELANISEDNGLFMTYVENEEAKGYGYCRVCCNRYTSNKLKALYLRVADSDICACNTSKSFYSRVYNLDMNKTNWHTSWSANNKLESPYRFKSKTELDNATADSLLFNKHKISNMSSEFDDPNVIKMRKLKHIDSQKVLEILKEMGYSNSAVDVNNQHKYIKTVGDLLASNYEALLALDKNDIPISAYRKEAEARTYKTRILNEGTAAINGKAASMLFLDIDEARVNKWMRANSHRLTANCERVDGAIVGAINALVKL